MMSQSTSTRDERILDAVRDAVIVHGVRRTTANDIAERAGVSRMTFYRAMGTVDEAVLLTLTRDFTLGAASARAASQASTARERIVDFAIACVRTFATSSLIRSIAERDPELLVPYVADRFGHSQLVVLRQLEELIAEGETDDTITDRPALATTLLLAVQGVALSTKILDSRGELDDCLAELRLMLTAYLAADARRATQRSGD